MPSGNIQLMTRVGRTVPRPNRLRPDQRKSKRLQNPLSASLKALRTGRVRRRMVSPLGEYNTQLAQALSRDVGRKTLYPNSRKHLRMASRGNFGIVSSESRQDT